MLSTKQEWIIFIAIAIYVFLSFKEMNVLAFSLLIFLLTILTLINTKNALSGRLNKYDAFLSYMIFVILNHLCFSMIYLSLGLIKDGSPVNDLSSALYFSIVTWTTVGYGDIQPSEYARFFAAAEAFIGYIYMGILMSIMITFINKSSD